MKLGPPKDNCQIDEVMSYVFKNFFIEKSIKRT